MFVYFKNKETSQEPSKNRIEKKNRIEIIKESEKNKT